MKLDRRQFHSIVAYAKFVAALFAARTLPAQRCAVPRVMLYSHMLSEKW